MSRHGDGLIGDAFRAIKRKAVDAYESVSTALAGPRTNMPPSARRILQEFGSRRIDSITVARKPIQSAIERALSLFTAGKATASSIGYDNLFHLYLVIRIGANFFRLEKNHTINLARQGHAAAGSETRLVQLNNRHLTLDQLIANGSAEAQRNGRSLFVYDSVRANCQKFVIDILHGSGLRTDEQFVLQPVEKIVPGFLANAARSVTDLASRANVIWEGAGLGKPIRTMKFSKEEYTTAQARNWLSANGYLRMAPARATTTHLHYRVKKV